MKELFFKNQNYNRENAEFLQTAYGLDGDFARLFSSRGVTKENAERYFNFDEENIYDPSLMKNLTVAAEKIRETMNAGGKILIYGDYDADGLTASAILKLFFNNNGTECDVLIPTRDLGYGMHTENVLNAFENEIYDLIVTVDCGVSNKEEIDELQQELGVDVIVTDHHEIPRVLPDCVCVNPKSGYPFPYLAGAGVALKLIQALGGKKQSENYYDLAAVGTIADMMPLVDENRDLVKIGLKKFKHKGLVRLAELSNCKKPFTACDIALKIAPKINAAGRIGDPYLALSVLLMQDNLDEAVIQELLSVNEERKNLVEETIRQAEEKLNSKAFMKNKLIFLYDDNWKNGVLGIAANRFKEAYGLPAVFMTRDGENYVGSARGTENMNLYDLFDSASDILVKFGGHRASVGFTVSGDNLAALKQRLTAALETVSDADADCSVCYYDLDFDPKYLIKENFEKFEILQPLLPNDRVSFYVKDYAKIATLFGSDKNHIKILLDNGLELKGFYRFSEYYEALSTGAECEVLFNLEYDTYSKRVVGIINYIRLKNSLHFEELYAQNLLPRLIKGERKTVGIAQAADILSRASSLAVFSAYEEYEAVSSKIDFSDFKLFFFSQNSYVDKSVLISPVGEEIFSRYANVVVFGDYDGFYSTYASAHTLCQIKGELPSCLNLKLDRAVCATVYKALLTETKALDMKSLYLKLRLADVNFSQFIAAVKVFNELNLLKFTEPFGYEILRSEKTDLLNSDTFKLLNKVD